MTDTAKTPDVMAVPLLELRDRAVDAMLAGSCGWLVVPAGGTVKVERLERKRCYRVTLDVRPLTRLAEPRAVDEYLTETRRLLADLLERLTS